MRDRQNGLVALEDFCVLGSGGTPSRSNAAFYGGNIPWVKSGELREREIFHTEETITEAAIKSSSAKVVPAGAILLAMYGATVGRLAMLGVDAATNQAICNIRPDVRIADAKYVYRALEAKVPEIIAQASGGAQPNISQEKVRKLHIPLPPLSEQKRIAAILDKADQLRSKRRQAIALLDSLTQSIFLEMFGDLVANNRQLPFGNIASFVSDFETGKNLAPDPDNSDPLSYRVLKVSAVTSGKFRPEEVKALPKEYSPPNSHIVRNGDLLFSRANTEELIGATAIVSGDFNRLVLPDKVWRFVWNRRNKPNIRFMHGMFSSPPLRAEISKRSSGTSGSMKNISKEKVLSIRIGLPDLTIQNVYAEKVDQIEICRRQSVEQLDLFESQFSSLQHRAFSGQL